MMVFSEAERQDLFMALGHRVKEICIHSHDRKGALTWWYACYLTGKLTLCLPVCRETCILPHPTSNSVPAHVPKNVSARSAVLCHLLQK